MPLPLEKWQERLEGHFQTLAATRTESSFPLFALEHGLSDEEIDEISTLLRSRLRANLRLAPHWLVWAVYATEQGYTYTGEEYWRSFEEQTLGWNYSDRYQIVSWFAKFQKSFDGVVPSGPWAEHFRIIAWPITHAILPRYLQRQFARVLYELRFSLAGLKTIEPAAIGRMLAANAHHASARFQEFLQQEELTGRIVLALLRQDPSEGEEPIFPKTLSRIVNDLERVRNAREWLKETQRVVSDRFKGIGHGSGPSGSRWLSDPRSHTTDGSALPDIRPSLLLRYAGEGKWTVVIEIPSFRNMSAFSAEIRMFLKRTRCSLNGANDMKPRGWLLSGKRRAMLKFWPDPQKPLIEFENRHYFVDQLLASDCRLSTGPVWLFRIGRDGTAREIFGHIVRPGYDYIVLTTTELPDHHDCISPSLVDCSGVKSFRINVPSEISAEDTQWFAQLGLQIARTIRVWPAGFPGRSWNGEGDGEWLTTEAPCFGVVHDHPIDAYSVRLDDGPETFIKAGHVGFPVFMRLSPLPAGKHLLSIRARRSSSLSSIVTSPAAEGYIELRVREPEPWIPGTSSHAGLIPTLDPQDANLDTFWENDVSLSVLGPKNRKVTCTVSLESGDGVEILSEQIGSPMDLPLTPDVWKKRFAHFVKHEDYAWRYLGASSGRLAIRGEELGEYEIRFERTLLPVRWVLRRDHGKIILRLIDDTDQEESEPTIHFYDMKRPAKAERGSTGEVFSGLSVDSPGGLFVAQHGEHSDAIVVSTGLTGQGLQGLSVRSEFCDVQDSTFLPGRALSLLAMWSEARLAGFLSNIRRQKIVDGFLSATCEKLCGTDWGEAEAAFLESPNARLTHATDILQRAVDRRPSFAVVLRRGFERMNDDTKDGSLWFSGVAKRYRICPDTNLCDFALRLASEPQRLPLLCGTGLEGLLGRLGEKPALLRGARFLALLCANQNTDGSSILLPRWKW